MNKVVLDKNAYVYSVPTLCLDRDVVNWNDMTIRIGITDETMGIYEEDMWLKMYEDNKGYYIKLPSGKEYVASLDERPIAR